ncbi:MAG TPA: GNAT family N-acetyltransferase [Caulobacteraceae bacterium]|nr:GNAT family N-acetyltransferase [Caulobacteraceae bacterium]
MTTGLERLQTQRRTGFRLDARGRLLGLNSPEDLPPPRFVLAGCAVGNLASVSAWLDEATAAELLTLALDEPPFWSPGSAPLHLERYLAILDASEAEIELDHELTPDLPPWSLEGALVASETAEGAGLLEALRRGGMPAGLFDMGFVDVGEFWAPWCAVIVEGEVASIAFAARLSDAGAAVGVATAPAFRGRGLGAAAVAGWTRLPALRGRRLFYSTRLSNRASRAVVERLGLTAFGLTLSVP